MRSKAEYQFLDFARDSRTPGHPGPSKKGAPALMSSDVSTLDGWTHSNLHASDVTHANLGKVSRYGKAHDEPSNEELGIVPYTGWKALLSMLIPTLPYVVTGVVYGVFLVGKARGWFE